jgi:hypothetical protein
MRIGHAAHAGDVAAGNLLLQPAFQKQLNKKKPACDD